MERLTQKDLNYCEVTGCKVEICKIDDLCYEYKLYAKLKEYEDLEEQGLLLRLPCKVGDTVYVINSFHIDGSLRKNSKLVETKFNVFMFDYIGKTVFLTREEAERKLQELQENE